MVWFLLRFPGKPRNGLDGIFNPELVLTVQASGNPLQATFNFVV
jgi:hypothetical protein